jgi:hypothetical protein
MIQIGRHDEGRGFLGERHDPGSGAGLVQNVDADTKDAGSPPHAISLIADPEAR